MSIRAGTTFGALATWTASSELLYGLMNADNSVLTFGTTPPALSTETMRTEDLDGRDTLALYMRAIVIAGTAPATWADKRVRMWAGSQIIDTGPTPDELEMDRIRAAGQGGALPYLSAGAEPVGHEITPPADAWMFDGFGGSDRAEFICSVTSTKYGSTIKPFGSVGATILLKPAGNVTLTLLVVARWMMGK